MSWLSEAIHGSGLPGTGQGSNPMQFLMPPEMSMLGMMGGNKMQGGGGLGDFIIPMGKQEREPFKSRFLSGGEK